MITSTDVFDNYFKRSRGQLDGEPIGIKSVNNISNEYTVKEPGVNIERYTSEDNIDDVDKLIDLIRLLLDRAWGEDAPYIVDQYPSNQDPEEVKMPMIVYDYYNRSYVEKTRKAPNIMDKIVIDNVHYEILSEWYDCELEFNVCSETVRSAKVLTKKFEIFLQTYIQYFKYVGISNMFFDREVRSEPYSRNGREYPKRTLIYKLKLERRYIRRPGDVLTNIEGVLRVDGKNMTGTTSDDGLPGIYIKYGEK